MKSIAILTLALVAGLAQAGDNWTSTNGQPVRSGTGLCWRDANWTPATAHPDCDGALKAASAPAPAPVAKVAAVSKQLEADTLFDFDKAVIKPDGKVVLNQVVASLAAINYEVVIVVGHTDSVGTEAYNQKLSERRANAVKAFLVSKGIAKDRIYSEGKGETQPVASNKTKQGRAMNRRVVIEVIGTVK